ncbi:hypothetical protein ACFLZP_00420 [Patescibacteria group bacterium]
MPKLKIEPYLVVPKLIRQSTWGGEYILKSKGWLKKHSLKGLKIGQSYELFSQSYLQLRINDSRDPQFTGQLGSSTVKESSYSGQQKDLLALQDLIKKDPEAVLGSRVLKIHGQKPGILVKFTQAKGNSFQIHISAKAESPKWSAKAESWYYLKPGLLTLGLKRPIKGEDFRACCLSLDKEMKILVGKIKSGDLTVLQARQAAEEVVAKKDPWQYVNLVKAQGGDLIDLSQGGLHHSWEQDEKNYPLGNLVYELCQDVMDPISTLRCFDRGKIKDDGGLRMLNIKDYFSYLNQSPGYNDPESHRLKPRILSNNSVGKIEALLRTPGYSLDRLTLKKSLKGQFCQTSVSYHHLFLEEGKVNLLFENKKINLSCGHSVFVPAATGNYQINPVGKKQTVVLKTFVA